MELSNSIMEDLEKLSKYEDELKKQKEILEKEILKKKIYIEELEKQLNEQN